MSNIECSVCRTIVDVTADTIALPFVCFSCVGEIELDDFTDQEYIDMEPKSNSVNATASTLNQPTEEFSTIENTTLLIEDLESQLTQERILSNSLKLEIENLQDRNDGQRRIIEDGTNYTIDLEKRVNRLDTVAQRTTHALLSERRAHEDIRIVTNSIVKTLTNKMSKLLLDLEDEKNRTQLEKLIGEAHQSTIQKLQSDLKFTIMQREAYHRLMTLADKKNELNAKKSLWTIFKERHFDTVTENAGYAG